MKPVWLAMTTLSLLGGIAAPAMAEPIPWAYTAVAEAQGVPSGILYAAALNASGAKLPDGCARPWPWTLRFGKKVQHYASRNEAETALQTALNQGVRRIGIGLMQLAWPDASGQAPGELLEPYLNLRVGAAQLREGYARSRRWSKAVRNRLAKVNARSCQPKPRVFATTPAQAGASLDLRARARPDVAALVDGIAPQYGLDPDLVLAVIGAESSGNPLARSNKNAQGLMQLIPATAERFGVSNVWNPEDNIRGGTAYLNWLLRRFNGDVALTLAGYNAGEKAVEQYGGIPPYAETQGYVRKILGHYGRSRHPVPPPLPGEDNL